LSALTPNFLKPLKPDPEDNQAANDDESSGQPSDHPFSQAAVAAETPLNPFEAEVIDLYQQNAPGLFRFAEGLVRDREMAQDALQEVFLRYFIARNSGQEIENGKAWLYRVLRNYLLDRVKEAAFRSKANIEEAETIPDASADPEQQYFRTSTREQIQEVLAPRELECLQLRADGFDYQEIARILSIRPGTVGATLARALSKIRKALNPSSGEHP